MDNIAAAEERLVNERLRQKLNEVNIAVKSHLTGVQDHVEYTLQQAYFKCAYECFDMRKKQEEIGCSAPANNAHNLLKMRWPTFKCIHRCTNF